MGDLARVLTWIVVIGLGVLVLLNLQRKPDGAPVGQPVGQPAPDIEGEDIDGQPFKLSDYRGKVVVLDFWGNW
jgi:cytochrome oxidase Cu insertion factor (SCO1/SenC/PrrC family)